MMCTIEQHLQKCVEEKVFPGAAYLFGTSEEILGHGCVGTLGVGRGPAEESTLYDIASVTKPIVAMAFMKLLEEGKVCLDDTIEQYLPEYAEERNGVDPTMLGLPGGAGRPKGKNTMFQLLTHTSVIPGQVQLYRTCCTKQELLDAIRYLPPRDNIHFPVAYSSQGMILIGQVIEAITGVALDEAMRKLVFEPLAMKDTMFNPPDVLRDRIASTEECPWRGKTIIGQVHDENAVIMGGVGGHAGLFSTTDDLARVARAMLTGKDAQGNRYFYRSTIEVMTRNHTKNMNLARGLGWQCRDEHDSPAGDLFSASSYGHTGFTGTSIWIDPERDLFAVLLTNRVNPTRKREGIARARHIFHNLVVYAWEDAQ